MTWLEMAIKRGHNYSIADSFCPQYIYDNGLYYDRETVVSSIDGIIGCRGITCEECWNQKASNLPNNQKG